MNLSDKKPRYPSRTAAPHRVSRLQGHGRSGCDRHPQAVRPDGHVHVRPRLHVHRRLRIGHYVHRRRQGRAAVPRLPHRTAGRELRLHGHLLPDPERRTAERDSEGRFRLASDPSHDGERAAALLPARLPPRRAPDGRADRPGRRAVGVLPRLHRHHQSPAPPHLGHPPDRQDADAGRDGASTRKASPSSIRRTTCPTRATSCA